LTSYVAYGKLVIHIQKRVGYMTEKRLKRQKEIASIFKIYNGSAVAYHPPASSNKSISQICATGSKIVAGISIGSLINAVRK